VETFALFFAVLAYLAVAVGLPSFITAVVHRAQPIAFQRGADPFQRAMGALFALLLLGLVAWSLLVGLVGAGSLGVWSAPPALAVVGWVLAGLGTLATVVAQWRMGPSWRIGVDDRPTALVTGGPFALVRNPIFSAMLVTLAGVVLVTPAPWTVVGWLVIAALIAFQVRLEERQLAAVHGRAWAEYAARVGRFVPGLGRLRADSVTGAPASPRR